MSARYRRRHMNRARLLAFALLVAPLSACSCDEAPAANEPLAPIDELPPAAEGEGEGQGEGEGTEAGVLGLYIALGDDVPSAIAARIPELLTPASPLPVIMWTPSVVIAEGSRVVSVGDTPFTAALITPDEVVIDEGYVLRGGVISGATVLAADGAGRGVAYGAYALLEELGFSFLHPLAPTRPTELAWPANADDVVRASAPRWPYRNWHLHTMHPLELTDMLNNAEPLDGERRGRRGWLAGAASRVGPLSRVACRQRAK